MSRISEILQQLWYNLDEDVDWMVEAEAAINAYITESGNPLNQYLQGGGDPDYIIMSRTNYQQSITDIIGEDERGKFDGTTRESHHRNQLRAEQRKRAGL